VIGFATFNGQNQGILDFCLPITAIVYVLALTNWFSLSTAELITFTVGAVMLVLVWDYF
jgi:hypothetical protein